MIADTAKVYPDVQFGKNVVVEDFCIIGCPAKGQEHPSVSTVIGDGAIIRSHTVIYAGNIIGKNFQTGNKANIRENNSIGDNVSVATMSVIEHHVTIANGVRIHSQVFVPEYSELEEHCWLGPNVVLTNAKYPKSKNAKSSLLGCRIKRNAKIGANSTLLPGVVIGENCLIGAGSTVTRSIESEKVAFGSPAKLRGNVKY